MVVGVVVLCMVNVFEELEICVNLLCFLNLLMFLQLFIYGEFIGGCDIVLELFEFGEFKCIVEEVFQV